jgi:hypothetical protein
MTPPSITALSSLKLIFLFSAINAIYVSLLQAFSLSDQVSYVFTKDLFGDFIKVVLSYPGGKDLVVNGNFGLLELFREYANHNPYSGMAGFSSNGITHFHLPPLTTLLSLLSLNLMWFIPPQIVFYLSVCLVTLGLIWLTRFVTQDSHQGWIWAACLLCSYPFLFALQRGNLFSLLVSILIFFFVISILRNKNILLGVICLAIAVNIRPNTIFLLPALVFLPNEFWLKKITIFVFVSLLVFFLSTWIDHSLYQDYSLEIFLKGLAVYHSMYVVGGSGDAYNSSLLGLLKALSGYSKRAEIIGLIVGVVVVGFAVFGFLTKKFDKTATIFLLCIACMLSTAVFADYHLLLFFLPLFAMSIEAKDALSKFSEKNEVENISKGIIFCACIFLLSPKNYLFVGDVSILILLNPVIAVVSTIFLIFYRMTRVTKAVISKGL